MSDEILQFRFQNLHEFVKVARQNLDRNNWDYLIGGSESETTLARNRLALDSLGFRPRVLRDVSNVDCTGTLFGKRLRIFEILEDEIRICLSLLGVSDYHELDKSCIRPARQVVPPHVHSAFPHLNLARETY